MRHSLLAILLPTLAFSLVPGCKSPPPAPKVPGPPLSADQVLATNATVGFLNVETGCWALDTPKGSYITTGLPSQYQVDRMPVYVVIRGAPSVVSLCMMGPLVSVDSIRRR